MNWKFASDYSPKETVLASRLVRWLSSNGCTLDWAAGTRVCLAFRRWIARQPLPPRKLGN